MDNHQRLSEAFAKLDRWVGQFGTEPYMPADLAPFSEKLQVYPLFGMQQVRQEILEFSQVILEQNWIDPSVLEIGLGYFGSSHIHWRNLFNKVFTVELQHDRVNRFSYNTRKFYTENILNDGRSYFIIGSSQDPKTVQKVYDNVSKTDMLFIDGDHSYGACLSDWLLYSPLVKSGGIVAFDDSHLPSPDGGVPRFLQELSAGKFGLKPLVKDISYSKIVGISYYIVD